MTDSPLSGTALLDRIDRLAEITETPGLTRRYLTPEHARANLLVGDWMREAGMAVRTDEAGNLIGRYEGDAPARPALLLGSHLDTVVDAGRYDGMLGVLTAIACVAELNRQGRRMPFAIEIVGFGDEEGVRFGATLLGSHALAGTFGEQLLDQKDGTGMSMADAMRAFGLDPQAIGRAARKPEEILAYLELHIEQGPVLEREGLAVGAVTAIVGFTRLMVELTGMAGHAGTVPMTGRKDAAAGAAECVLAVEKRGGAEPDLVATVGRIAVRPGAMNVIAGRAEFSVDIRSPTDAIRLGAVRDIRAAIEEIAARRGLGCAIRLIHEDSATLCDAGLIEAVERAIVACGHPPRRLVSGAGHDAMAIATIARVAMLFVRCKGGVSHNPAESITAADAQAGAEVLLRIIEDFRA